MKTLVIYHGGACADGFCAAWVLRRACPDAEFVAANYGEAPPAVESVVGRDVIIADFSFPRATMLQLASFAQSLTVLDHHRTAAAELDGFEGLCVKAGWPRPTVVFDMGKSGARLAWEYVWDVRHAKTADGRLTGFLFRGLEAVTRDTPPWLVRYVEDRDLWRWELPHSRAVNASVRSHPFDFAAWDRLAEASPYAHAAEGTAILRREQQIVDQHVRHAREVELAGHKVLAVNATVLISEIAGELAKDRPFGACYFDDAGLRRWSLRSRDGGADVSEVAKQFGGGGHKQAAGFEVALS